MVTSLIQWSWPQIPYICRSQDIPYMTKTLQVRAHWKTASKVTPRLLVVGCLLSPFGGTTLLGEGSGGWGVEAKADQTTDCNGAESYVTITCIAGFSHSVLSSFDLHYQYLQKTANTSTLSWGVRKGVQIVYFPEVTSAPFEDIVSTMFRGL